MNLSTAIRVIMAEQNVRPSEVISRTGWSDAYVAQCRRGAADPQARIIEWALALNVSPSELMSRAEAYPDPQPTAEEAA